MCITLHGLNGNYFFILCGADNLSNPFAEELSYNLNYNCIDEYQKEDDELSDEEYIVIKKRLASLFFDTLDCYKRSKCCIIKILKLI